MNTSRAFDYGQGVSLDITERKGTEEALRVSQQRLELAQEAAGIGIWDWDATTGEFHCSSGHNPLYGLPPSDRAPSFEEWLELIDSEDRVRMREELGRVIERADHFSTEFRVVWPDGTIHSLYGQGQVFRDSRGNPVRMIGVNMDISERKRAEAAMRESEERFRNMADTAPVMIWVSGPDKSASFFNKCCLVQRGPNRCPAYHAPPVVTGTLAQRFRICAHKSPGLEATHRRL